MPNPEWKIQQPEPEDMRSPVQCRHCRKVYDLGFVHVLSRYSDCTVYLTPCCGRNVDDRPGGGGMLAAFEKLTTDEAVELVRTGHHKARWGGPGGPYAWLS